MSQIIPFFPSSSSLAAHGSDGVALICAGEKITYAVLSRQAHALTAQLAEQGVKTGDLIAVLGSSFTMSRMLYAALYLGLAAFPLDKGMAGERRNRLLAQAGCRWVISEIELGNLPEGVKGIQINLSVLTDEVMAARDNLGEVRLVVATSGSEGEPKGVMLSGANIAASLAASRNRLGLKPGDIWLNCLPMFHIGGIMIAYRCLDAGAGMLLHSGFDADRVWADMNEYRVTHISLVPAMLARLLDVSADAPPPDSLRVALVGGGHLAPELAARAQAAGWSLCVSYGMSECCSQCATDCDEGAGLVPGLVGFPLDGFEIALSEHSRIMLRGPAVMLGYVNPGLSPGHGLSDDGWFETGDLGEIDTEGRLRVLGRADDVLISGGKTIHPSEIEDLLTSCPGVYEAAVTGRTDQTWGNILVAVYSGDAPVDSVEYWCRINIPSALRPRVFMRMAVLPRNDVGKWDRKALRAMSDQG